MSGIISGFQKFFTKERIIIFVVLGVLLFFLMSYSEDKYSFADGMNTDNPRMSSDSVPPNNSSPKVPSVNASSVPSAAVQPIANGGYTSQGIADTSDLLPLPLDPNAGFSSLNSAVTQGNPITPDLLQAGYHIGLDTIGQSLKNPNLQLRSDPYIPKAAVGPWNQSTYEPDLTRVPLEVGVGPQ